MRTYAVQFWKLAAYSLLATHLTASAQQLETFTLMAGSRHPKHHPSYDKEKHQYKKSYLRPGKWTLLINACSQLPKREFLVSLGWPLPPSRVVVRPVVPENVVAYEWRIQNRTSGHVEGKRTTPPSFDCCKTEVSLSETGEYEITLRVILKNGVVKTSTQRFHLRDYFVVSIGDSFASGEGNPDADGSTYPTGAAVCEAVTLAGAGIPVHMASAAHWSEPLTHRSWKSGPSYGAENAQDLARGLTITFASFASSGATITEGLLAPQYDPIEFEQHLRSFPSFSERSVRTLVDAHRRKYGVLASNQIEQVRQNVGDRLIDALVITIGGNDVGFAPALRDLTKTGEILLYACGKSVEDGAVFAYARQQLATIPANLASVNRLIREKLRVRQIYLTEYPTGLFDSANGQSDEGCGIFDTAGYKISRNEAAQLREFGKELNATLERVAGMNGWIYIGGIDDGFRGHGYCSRQSFFIAAEDSCNRQGDISGTMHPNSLGIITMGSRIRDALRQTLR
jgi:hypothetical protein